MLWSRCIPPGYCVREAWLAVTAQQYASSTASGIDYRAKASSACMVRNFRLASMADIPYRNRPYHGKNSLRSGLHLFIAHLFDSSGFLLSWRRRQGLHAYHDGDRRLVGYDVDQLPHIVGVSCRITIGIAFRLYILAQVL